MMAVIERSGPGPEPASSRVGPEDFDFEGPMTTRGCANGEGTFD